MKTLKAIKKLFTAALATTCAAAAITTAAHAGTVDLTQPNASGTINGAIFSQVDPQPTGTGVIDPFVRIQATGTEQGYNTDNASFQFDEKAGIWTHSLTLDQVGTVTILGLGAIGLMRPRRNPLAASR